MDNILLPFLLEKTNVRGRITRLGSTVDEVIKQHDYPEVINKHLSELIAVCSALAGMLDYEGVFTLQTSGDGEASMMVVDIDSNGNIRAYAKYNPEIKEDTSFNELMGKGYIAFTVDQAGNAKRYQGLVEIQQDSFDNCIKHYFESSEQIETALRSYSEKVEDSWRSGAVIIQKLPEDKDVDFTDADIFLGTCMDKELVDTSIEAKDLLYRLFHELKPTVYEEQNLVCKCRCARSKIEDFLKTLPANELDELAEKGKIDVKCEFCAKNYHFKRAEIKCEK